MPTADESLAIVLDALHEHDTQLSPLVAQAHELLDSIVVWETETWHHWLAALCETAPTPPASAASAKLLDALIDRLHRAMLGPTGFDSLPTTLDARAWLDWYSHLDPAIASRGRLLTMLARNADRETLSLLAKALGRSGLPLETESDLLFATFMQSRSPHLAALFPDLLEIGATPAFAASVLDLANFMTREGIVKTHPALDRLDRFAELLGRLVVELERIEQHPAQDAALAQQQQTILSTVPLAVALCDAFALANYLPALPRLVDALHLGHRRLRCEAAWALAQMGDERGRKELLMLAAEPVARRRVLTYAEELQIADQIEPEYQTEQALAEADLALWLSEPSRMGLAPTDLKLLDSRCLAWPGFDEPVQCFLFLYTYDLGQARYENIGIAGPDAQSVTADLRNLSFPECYSLFAGLQCEHEEIQEFEVKRLSEGFASEIARLERRMRDANLEQIEPERFGLFFGERVLAARASRRGAQGIAVADSIELIWNSTDGRRPLGVTECMAIYRGRKLLGAFNDGFAAESSAPIDSNSSAPPPFDE